MFVTPVGAVHRRARLAIVEVAPCGDCAVVLWTPLSPAIDTSAAMNAASNRKRVARSGAVGTTVTASYGRATRTWVAHSALLDLLR
jgi:hypothetical protein